MRLVIESEQFTNDDLVRVARWLREAYGDRDDTHVNLYVSQERDGVEEAIATAERVFGDRALYLKILPRSEEDAH